MKKKLVSGLLAATMVASLLFGCGDSGSTDTGSADNTEASGGDTTEAPSGDEHYLNAYVFNDEFINRVKDHYPDYEEVDATTGKIGDVTVKWNITPTDDNAYQNNLDESLLKQADAADNDKVDLFLVEADYIRKYVNSDTVVAMDIAELGITDADTANQYQYTKDLGTDDNGVLRALSWQGCPGVLFYNREAAKEILGSDDPATVQEAVKDWATFNATAAKVKDAGYLMTSTAFDTFRTYSDNVTSAWVVDGKVNVDDNIMKWVDEAKAMVDAGYTTANTLWSDEWNQGFFPDGKVFCYFGPAWLINFCMAADQEGSLANTGGWGATEGPQGFSWGGTWVCAAEGTDDADIIKDIMLKLTCDEAIMKDIVTADDDFVNNQPAMEAMADSDYTSSVLGGQNPLGMYANNAKNIQRIYLSNYDQGCVEEFQNAMKEYFLGNQTKEEALEAFKSAIVVKYPDLTAE